MKDLFCQAVIYSILICASSFMPVYSADQLSDPTQPGTSEAGQYIRTISFHGNSAVNGSNLAELLGVNPGQRFDPQQMADSLSRVLNEYKKLGYLFAKIGWECETMAKDQVAIHINIHEGEIVKVGSVEFSGNAIFSRDQLINLLDFRRGTFFDEPAFQRDMDKLLEIYSDNGHPLAKVSPSEFQLEDGRLNIKIDIDEGPLVKIQQIQINGLQKTRENIILRELTVRPGDVFHQRKIDENQRRLNNMGYFQSVKSGFTPASVDDNVILDLSVTEGRTGQFSGVLGYNPSEDEAGGQKFTGMLEAVETNLLGTGRQLAIRARLGLIDTYEFSYLEPWLLGVPIDIGIRLWGTKYEASGTERQGDIETVARQQGNNETSGQEQAVSLSMNTRVVRSLVGALAVTFKQIESPVSGGAGILPASSDGLIKGRKYSLTLTIQRDSRDYFINPSAGRLDRASVEVSRGDFKTIRTSLDLSQYLSIRKRQVLALWLHGARIWGEEIPLTEMLYLGGATTLRGYGEDLFRGEGSLSASCEYRLLMSRDSQLFIFLDGGTVYKRDNGLDPLKLGYGVGMRLKSQNSLISVNYGLARGDSILQGKIHVSLGAMF